MRRERLLYVFIALINIVYFFLTTLTFSLSLTVKQAVFSAVPLRFKYVKISTLQTTLPLTVVQHTSLYMCVCNGLYMCVCLSPHSVTPIFTLSSVSGENLDLLKVFFNILPPLSNSKEQEELMQQLTEFQVLSQSNQHAYVVLILDVTLMSN